MSIVRFTLLLAALFIALTACQSESSEANPTPDPTAQVTSQESPTPEPTLEPSPTVEPAPTEEPTPSPTAEPTPTTAPPTPTAEPTSDPEIEPVAWYIEDLRNRHYDGCCIERLRVYEQTAEYTSWVIAYQSEGLRVTGLMATPNQEGPFPVAIINHGYFPFDEYDTGYDTIREVRYMASNGYVAVAPDYRNYAGSDDGDHIFVPGYVYDVRNLIEALKQMPEVDASRIGMTGHSMGGEITLKLLASGADIKVAALFGTVTANEAERWEARISRWGGSSQATEFSERYGTPLEVPEIYAKMSPSSYWEEINVPVIIHHGDADTTTPIEWAYDIEQGLREAGKPVEMHVYVGAGHSFNGNDFDQVMARTLAFFDNVLRRPTAGG